MSEVDKNCPNNHWTCNCDECAAVVDWQTDQKAYEEGEGDDPSGGAWTCCGVPVKVLGLDVVCQGTCGRRTR